MQNVVPFFRRDIIIQQYGTTAVTSTYNAIGMIKSFIDLEQPASAGTSAKGLGVAVKSVALDLTQSYAVDVRTLQATPVVGEYYEPTIVRMWAYN